MILIHQFETSPFCDKVRRVLDYKGVSYSVRNYSMQETLSGKIKSLNKAGKLPVVELDGAVIADSTDIVAAIEQRFPERPVVPADPKQKSLVHLLEDWADESLYFFEVYLRMVLPGNVKIWGKEVAKQDNLLMRTVTPYLLPIAMKRMLDAQGLGRKTKEQVFAELDQHVASINGLLSGQHYLVGESLTLADISVYSQLQCCYLAPEGKAVIQAYPEVVDWLARIEQETRPAS